MIDGYSRWLVTVIDPTGAMSDHWADGRSAADAVRIVLRRAAFQDGRIVVKVVSSVAAVES